MIRKILLLVPLLVSQLAMAQAPPDPNQGGTLSSNYYTVISYKQKIRKIIIPVTINGKQRKFLLDTGAPLTVSSALALELGLGAGATKYPVTDQSGKVDSMAVLKLKALTLGDIEFNDVPALIADDTSMKCLQLDGIIGSNVLRNSIVRFSQLDSTITITDDASKLSLNKVKRKQVSDLVPSADNVSDPYLKIVLRGKNAASEEVLFDTGMDGLYDICLRNFQQFAPHDIFYVRAQGYGSYSMGLHGVAADSLQYKLLVPKLEINNVIFKNVIVRTTSGNNSRVGAHLLNYGVVTVDYRNRKFYFEPFPKYKDDLYKKQYPFDPISKDGKLVVGIIWEKDLMGKIKVGDQILSVNDYNCQNLTLCEMLDTEFPVDENRLEMTVKGDDGNIKTMVMLAE